MNEDGISMVALLPLEWRQEDAPSATVQEQRRLGNISLLKALAAIEVSVKETDDVPESVRRSLERVESKLDVLLMLVAGLALKHTAMPAESEVTLSQGHISWKENAAAHPVNGQALSIHLFPSPRIPHPLILRAVVSRIDAGEIRADFTELDQELEEWLTRTIFRYHRRAVHARKQP